MNNSAFRFLIRPGCHLCDEARPVVEKAVARVGAALNEIDIDADDALTRDYGLRVPVLLGPGDVVLAEGRIEAGALRRALRRSRT
ncbi:MAG TPA: glutaredoxin family protein [Acidimicrobiia bacterium]|nr:glutaredoxin family protein [Acidimicrobiia bacterium]